MTTETLAPFDPLADAIAALDGWPEADRTRPRTRRPASAGDRRPRRGPATS